MVEFNNPPITELVIDLSFFPISGLRGGMLADVRNLFIDEYPGYQEQPNISNETNGPNFQQQFFIRLGPQLEPLRRQWYTSNDEMRLFQIQQDRFITNWRPKSSGKDRYPSFKAVFEEYQKYLGRFEDFVIKNTGEKIHFMQWEITKLNLLALRDDWENHMSEIFSIFSNLGAKRLDGVSYSQMMLLKNKEEAFGRLMASIEIGVTPDNKKTANFKISAIGATEPGQKDICIERMMIANSNIDEVFISMTNDKIRKEVWGQK